MRIIILSLITVIFILHSMEDNVIPRAPYYCHTHDDHYFFVNTDNKIFRAFLEKNEIFVDSSKHTASFSVTLKEWNTLNKCYVEPKENLTAQEIVTGLEIWDHFNFFPSEKSNNIEKKLEANVWGILKDIDLKDKKYRSPLYKKMKNFFYVYGFITQGKEVIKTESLPFGKYPMIVPARLQMKADKIEIFGKKYYYSLTLCTYMFLLFIIHTINKAAFLPSTLIPSFLISGYIPLRLGQLVNFIQKTKDFEKQKIHYYFKENTLKYKEFETYYDQKYRYASYSYNKINIKIDFPTNIKHVIISADKKGLNYVTQEEEYYFYDFEKNKVIRLEKHYLFYKKLNENLCIQVKTNHILPEYVENQQKYFTFEAFNWKNHGCFFTNVLLAFVEKNKILYKLPLLQEDQELDGIAISKDNKKIVLCKKEIGYIYAMPSIEKINNIEEAIFNQASLVYFNKLLNSFLFLFFAATIYTWLLKKHRILKAQNEQQKADHIFAQMQSNHAKQFLRFLKKITVIKKEYVVPILKFS